jgi:cellulose synthase/poly-beta-1,6-N-acetylglucosamine synthase-like glycosyltransferase
VTVTVTAALIVKDEERVLARCLDSIAGAVDEIVLVDTGSTDRTKEIARRYTDRLFTFECATQFLELAYPVKGEELVLGLAHHFQPDADGPAWRGWDPPPGPLYTI